MEAPAFIVFLHSFIQKRPVICHPSEHNYGLFKCKIQKKKNNKK